MIENDIFCYRYIDESAHQSTLFKDTLKERLSSFNLNWEKTKYNYEDCHCPINITCLNEKTEAVDNIKVLLDEYKSLDDDPNLVLEEKQDFPCLVFPLQTHTDNIRKYIHSYLRDKCNLTFDFYVLDNISPTKLKAKLELHTNSTMNNNHTFFVVVVDNESDEDTAKALNILEAFTSKNKHLNYEKLYINHMEGNISTSESNSNKLELTIESIVNRIRAILIQIGEGYLKKIDTLLEEYKTQNSSSLTSRFNFFRIANRPDPALQKIKNKELLAKILHLNLYFYHIGKYSIFYHYNKLIIKECFKCRSLLTLLTCLYTQLNLLKESYFHICPKNSKYSIKDKGNSDLSVENNTAELESSKEEFNKFYCDEFIRFAVQFNQKLQENELEFGNNELSEALEAVSANGSNDLEYKRIYYIFIYIKLACLDFAFLIKYKNFYKDIFNMALHYIDKIEYNLKLLVLKQVVYFLYYSRRIIQSHLVRKALYYDMTLIKISDKAPEFCDTITEEVTSNKYYLNITDLINEILFLKIKKCLKDGNEEGCFNTYYSIINHYNRRTSKTPQNYLEISNNKCGKFYFGKVVKLLQKTKKVCLDPAFFSLDSNLSRAIVKHRFLKDPTKYKAEDNCIEYYEGSSLELKLQVTNNLIFELEINSIELVIFNKTTKKFQRIKPNNINTKTQVMAPISSLPLSFTFELNNNEISLFHLQLNTNTFHDRIPLRYDLDANLGFLDTKNNAEGCDRFQTIDDNEEQIFELKGKSIDLKPIQPPIVMVEEDANDDLNTTTGSFILLKYMIKTPKNETLCLKNIKSYNYRVWNYSMFVSENAYTLQLLLNVDRNCISRLLQIHIKALVAETEHNILIVKPLKIINEENCDIRRLEKRKLFLYVSSRQDYDVFENSFLLDHRNSLILFRNSELPINEIHKQNNIVEYNTLNESSTEIPNFLKADGKFIEKFKDNIIKETERVLSNSLYLSERLSIGKYDVNSIISVDGIKREYRVYRGVIHNEFTTLMSHANSELFEKDILEQMFTYSVSANKLEHSLYNVSFYCKSTFSESSLVKIKTKDKFNHYEWVDDGLSNVEIELTPENNEMILHKRINIQENLKMDSFEVMFIINGKYKDLKFVKETQPITFK